MLSACRSGDITGAVSEGPIYQPQATIPVPAVSPKREPSASARRADPRTEAVGAFRLGGIQLRVDACAIALCALAVTLDDTTRAVRTAIHS